MKGDGTFHHMKQCRPVTKLVYKQIHNKVKYRDIPKEPCLTVFDSPVRPYRKCHTKYASHKRFRSIGHSAANKTIKHKMYRRECYTQYETKVESIPRREYKQVNQQVCGKILHKKC